MQEYCFGCFTLPDGRRTQRSTKTTNRREALRIASEWEEAARRRLPDLTALPSSKTPKGSKIERET
jgi:hypothetical protein